jgi:hypothetical protein
LNPSPRINPRPRMFSSKRVGNHFGKSANRPVKYALVSAIPATDGLLDNRERTWWPSAHASGDPPNVVPWVPIAGSVLIYMTVTFNLPVVIVAATSFFRRTAPIGYPLARGLAIVTISGWHSMGRAE